MRMILNYMLLLLACNAFLFGQKIDSLGLLNTKIDILAKEIARLQQAGSANDSHASIRTHGLGPSAGAIYKVGSNISIAGYGEMLYQHFDQKDESEDKVNISDKIDFYRQILYFGYRFNNRFLFNSEIEYEHGSTGSNGEVSVEFAYIDFMVNEDVNLRAGLILIPMGIINEYHEPPTWYGTMRPMVETYIIPTTWRANGIGVWGEYGNVSYKLFVSEGLDASGFSASKSIRGGRQQGSKAKAENFALSGGFDYRPIPGFSLGLGAYYGDSGQNQPDQNGRILNIPTAIWSVNVIYEKGPFTIRGLYAQNSIGNTLLLNQYLNNGTDQAIASMGNGYYITASYNILAGSRFKIATLSPYLQYEGLNTQKAIASGYQINSAFNKNILAIGVGYKPIPQIIFKTDYRINTNAAETGVNQFNFVMGYMF